MKFREHMKGERNIFLKLIGRENEEVENSVEWKVKEIMKRSRERG